MTLDKLVEWVDTPEEELSGWHCGYEAARQKVRKLLEDAGVQLKEVPQHADVVGH